MNGAFQGLQQNADTGAVFYLLLTVKITSLAVRREDIGHGALVSAGCRPGGRTSVKGRPCARWLSVRAGARACGVTAMHISFGKPPIGA
jgi:hypothetical protein